MSIWQKFLDFSKRMLEKEPFDDDFLKITSTAENITDVRAMYDLVVEYSPRY